MDGRKCMKLNNSSFYDSSEDDTFISYKRRKSNKKFRTHLVSSRFLLMLIKVMASDILINRRVLNNIKRFLGIIDRDFYCVDESVEAMILASDLLLAIRLKNSTTGPNLETLIYKLQTTLQEPHDKIRDNLIIPQVKIAKDEIPEEDLEYISETLDQNLKYDYIYRTKGELVDLTNDISSCNYNDFPDLLIKYKDLITDIMNFFRSTDSSSRINEVVHTTDSEFLNFLKDTFDSIKNPSSSLQTGWQALNSALGPRNGFVNKNFYLFHANTNSFKSALLLHIARMISMYNTTRLMEDYKKTGKIPTVLFIELENDDEEDYERLYKTVVKRDMDRYTSEQELLSAWKRATGSLKEEPDPNIQKPIDISFLHLESGGISVEGIDTTIELIEEEGYHVITCIVDYIALIKPRNNDPTDNRLQLKHIAEDLLSLAKRRDIPVISAHQLNRSGGAILTNLKMQGGTMAVSQMTNEFIGESYGIEQAVSWSAFIDLETVGDKKYFTFKRNKSRKGVKYGANQFVMEIKDGIIIEDDIYLDKPLSMPNIPGETPDNSELMNVTSRGKMDIRDKPKETDTFHSAKKNNEITIKPDSYETKQLMTNVLDTMTIDEWHIYAHDVGWENVTYDAGEYDFTNNIVNIGTTEYYSNGTSISGFDD